MAHRVVIDTDALVGVLRDDERWVDRVRALRDGARLFTTDVNAFELYVGAYLSERRDRNVAAVKGLLNTVASLHTDEDAMEVAARMAAELRRRGEPLDVKDLLIGSIALVHRCAILTGNRDHFERVEGLEVLGPEG